MRAVLRVLLAGGGSGGSATPVLAVAQALRRREPDVELLYVGTRDGPEAALTAVIENRPTLPTSTTVRKVRNYGHAAGILGNP